MRVFGCGVFVVDESIFLSLTPAGTWLSLAINAIEIEINRESSIESLNKIENQ